MRIFVFLLLLLPCLAFAQAEDVKFLQPVSVKYNLPDELKGARLIKTMVDYDEIVYLLSDKGLYRAYGNEMVMDIRFRPLADKVPVDIQLQESTGYLYYLYNDKFLTNAYAGVHYGIIPSNSYQMMAVDARKRVLLAGGRQLAIHQEGKLNKLSNLKESIRSVYAHKGDFYVLSEKSIWVIKDEKAVLLHTDSRIQDIAFRNDEIIIGTKEGYFAIDRHTSKEVFPLQSKVPVPDVRHLMVAGDQVWAGTPMGAFTRLRDGSFRYFASKRWLDNDDVKGMSSDSQGNVYVMSSTGLNKIEFISQTLAEKAAFFEDKIRSRHMRYGFTTELQLQKPGDITSAQLADTDNDGLWTSFYLGSMAFKYAATGDEKALQYAWESFEAYERLLSINPLDGFPSRTFERKGFKYSDIDRWRDSQDPEWEWKGHTSSDEFVAYIFIAGVMEQFIVKTEGEKKRIADFLDQILMHLINNDYYFVDADGKPTLWGRWNPEYINWYPETIIDRKLGSVTLIAGLQLGYELSGNELYKKEAARLMTEHQYLDNIMIDCNIIGPTPGFIHEGHDMGMGGWNHSDDEMAFLSYWVLHHYAFNDSLQSMYAEAIHNHWEIELPEKNALWHTLTYGTEGSVNVADILWHLRGFPMDLIRYTVKNSHRKDITFLEPNFRKQITRDLLPPDETRTIRHNSNPFELDGGGGGRSELAGDEFLLPYWMARYLRLIE